MSAAPATPTGPIASPPTATPTTSAQTGSVPMRMLARAADVRRTAQSCTAKANTEQSSPRNSTSAIVAASIRDTAARRSAPAIAAKIAPPTISCTQTTPTELSSRPRVRCPLAVTWKARTTAAAMTSRSPAVGVRMPSPETSSATPTTAATAAAKYELGSHTRDARPSSAGVMTRARLMSRPALVAEVRLTPQVSRPMIVACVPPSATPMSRPRPRGRRWRVRAHSRAAPPAATRKRSALAAATPVTSMRSLATRKLAPQTAATASRARSTRRSGRRVTFSACQLSS
ncbi:hypothetical protein RM52_01460 [Microbacterium hominis]|uniref:Uncharacterized protein n=1 Tax=Microbacterium hominis TaxID=162426 RepID=A0A0B4E0M2_9MICO|nr:hypothetical protein RM52_01460 [Microbacterium hominis]